MFRKKILLLAALLMTLGVNAHAATYKVDPDHTSVGFKVRHLFSNVNGQFTKFDGTVDYEPGKHETWKTAGTIQVDSISTNVEQRDKHLRSPDFFDAEKFPTITYHSTKVLESTASAAKLEGLITIHGVEKPIVLEVDIHGSCKDPWGNTRLGVSAKTKINRKDFGLTWNKTLETGQLLVGDEVELNLEVEGVLPQQK